MSQTDGEKFVPLKSLIPGETAEELPFVSQRDFTPTPYHPSNWEVVGERIKEKNFVPLAVNIIHQEGSMPDPMFEVFEQGFQESDSELMHGSGVKRVGAMHEEEEEAVSAREHAEKLREWEQKVTEAYERGLAEGRSEVEAKISARYEELSARLKSITDGIYEQWAGLAGYLEKQALDLSLQVSQKILSTTVEAKPDYILTVIREALAALGAAKPVRIRISKQDFEFLNVVGLPDDLSPEQTGVTYVPDESITHGCIVESNFGELDMVLERMWEEVKAQIYQAKT